MRRLGLLSISALLVAGLFVFGCAGSGTDNSADSQQGAKIKRFYQSECKGGGGGGEADWWEGDGKGSVNVETHHNYIVVFHRDVIYNCASDIEFRLEANGQELVLTENDVGVAQADCVCPFDLEVVIANLEPGARYHLTVFNEDHSIQFADLWFTMDDCPPEWQCEEPTDCEYQDLIHPECVGAWDCIDHQCVWNCGEPMPCESDADCAIGEVCVGGQCLPTEVECRTDDDCAVWVLERGESNDEDEVYCPGQLVPACIEGRCEFICQPIECHTNADCPPGMECVFYDFTDYGFCEYTEQPNRCRTDADCPEGYHCEFFYYGEDGETNENGDPSFCNDPADPNCIPEPWGVCVEDPYPGECRTDADCPEGYHCEFFYYGEDGETNENGDPSFCNDPADPNCIPEPWGVCVEDPYPGECRTDADCPEGYVCEITYVDCADANVDGAEDEDANGEADCYPYEYGMCVPSDEPEPIDCRTDADCPEGYVCTYYPMNCQEDGEDCPESGAGICVPEEPPYPPDECRTNEDCPDGMLCEYLCGNGWCSNICINPDPEEE